MSIAFLEKYKVMLSILAVVVVGGVILAGTFETGERASAEPEQFEEQASNDDSEDAPKQEPESAIWGAASFDDMLGDEASSDEDLGFASSSSDAAPDGSQRSGSFEPKSNEDSDTAFAGGTRSENQSAASRPVKRVVADAQTGLAAPVSVDASLVSPDVGGKGQGVSD